MCIFKCCNGIRKKCIRISNLARDSASFAYSAFSLQTLQSPPPLLGLKSSLTSTGGSNRAAGHIGSSGRLGSSGLDSMDQTLLLHLSSLQANQLEDLANVLLPHLAVDPRAGSSVPSPPPASAAMSEDLLLEPLDDSNNMEYGGSQPIHHREKVRESFFYNPILTEGLLCFLNAIFFPPSFCIR